MPKFSKSERDKLKELVIVSDIQGLTSTDTASYIKEKSGLDISRQQVDYIKKSLRRESFSWIDKMKHTKDHYIYEFKRRVDEINIYRGLLYQTFISTDNDMIKVRCVEAIMKTTENLANLYDILPVIAGGHIIISNNSSTQGNNIFLQDKRNGIPFNNLQQGNNKDSSSNKDLPV